MNNGPRGGRASSFFPRPTKGSQRLLKYPILIIVILVVLIELLLYFILRLGVIIYECILSLCQCRSNSKLWDRLKHAKDYEEYVEVAKELDLVNRRNDWKYEKESYCYDINIIEQNLNQLKKYQNEEKYSKLSEKLIEIFGHTLKWFEEESLYTHCNYGTKFIVEEFLHNVEKSAKMIKTCTTFKDEDKLKIFVRLQQEFGRTALCLSGGATMTFYQFGVIKTLFKAGLLPNIISGTSGGSLVGSTIAVRTDKELESFINPKIYKYLNAASEPLIVRIERLLRTGFLFSWKDWRKKLRKLLKGDMTFYEAYQLTGRIYNVTAISTNHSSVLLNYKSTPDVCIWSAVIASSSLPGCMGPSPLIAKKYKDGKKRKEYELIDFVSYGKLYIDGSIKHDVPKQRLLEDFNVKYTICVQCNVHVFAFYYNGRGTANNPVSHWGRSGMRGGFLSSLLEKILKLELKKWMTVLSDFDLIPQIWSIDLRHMALQENRGTITMNPKAGISDLLRLTSDPDKKQFIKYLKKGTAMTYPYLYMIQNRIQLQNVLRDSIIYLDKSNNGNTLKRLLTEGYDLNDTLQSIFKGKIDDNDIDLSVHGRIKNVRRLRRGSV